MKLATFTQNGRTRIGVVENTEIVDLAADAQLPIEMIEFLALGGSYKSHLAEVAHLGILHPTNQTWFNKQVTCVNGPYDDIHLPRVSNSLDYEGELAIIIGARGRNVKGAAVRQMIAGFTVCNDVSV